MELNDGLSFNISPSITLVIGVYFSRVCDWGPCTLLNIENFKAHIEIHSKDRLICDICSKTYPSIQTLENHLSRFHLQTKKYECTECEKKFGHPGSLKLHLTFVHEKVRKYSCEICQKHFTRAQKVRNHMDQVHLGIRNHICKVCKKAFKQSPDLKKHMEAFHEKKRFEEM